MTELKTLKDIAWDIKSRNDGGLLSVKELKAEAIKWIKEDYEELYTYAQELIIKNWMRRLNISEEDLK